MAPQPPSDESMLWFFAVFVYLVAAALSFIATDGLERSEKFAVAVFWPLVVGYLAVTGLGKLCARLGQEKD